VTKDVRFALRTLLKRPGFTAVVILVLSLGIGSTTAIFSIVDALLLRSLPYPHADRLVQLREVNAKGNQINVAAAEVLRGKAMNLIAERVKVTDESGNPVDIATALNTPLTPAGDAADVDAADQEEILAATETDETGDADADAKA